MRSLVMTIAVALAAASSLAAPAAVSGGSSMHETVTTAEWAIPTVGATGPVDHMLSVSTRTGSVVSPGAGVEVTVSYWSQRIVCDASSDTYQLFQTYGTAPQPRGAFTMSGRGATLTGTITLATTRAVGTDCSQPGAIVGPGTVVGEATVTVDATWTPTGDRETFHECGRDLRTETIWVQTLHASDATATLTLGSPLALNAGSRGFLHGRMLRATSSIHPDNGTKTCDAWF